MSNKLPGLTSNQADGTFTGLIEAGAEITSVVINNLILYLAATPAAQRAAHAELDRVVGSDRAPNFADIPQLPYVRACVKEILRLCPVPTWAIKHFSDNTITYKQHVIPKGTVLLANTSAMHYDETRYPEPHVFRPERYLDHPRLSAEYMVAADPYARDHFTFGGGRRACPAARLAENTLDIAAAGLLWALEISPPKDGSVNTTESAFTPGAFRAPKPFKARFVPRDGGREEIIRQKWDQARENGYMLRGMRVSAKGVEQ